jgi:hypothetical protein
MFIAPQVHSLLTVQCTAQTRENSSKLRHEINQLRDWFSRPFFHSFNRLPEGTLVQFSHQIIIISVARRYVAVKSTRAVRTIKSNSHVSDHLTISLF